MMNFKWKKIITHQMIFILMLMSSEVIGQPSILWQQIASNQQIDKDFYQTVIRENDPRMDFESLYELVDKNSEKILRPEYLQNNLPSQQMRQIIDLVDGADMNDHSFRGREGKFRQLSRLINETYENNVRSYFSTNTFPFIRSKETASFFLIIKLIQDLYFMETTPENYRYVQTELFPAINKLIQKLQAVNERSMFHVLPDADAWFAYLASHDISDSLYTESLFEASLREGLLPKDHRKHPYPFFVRKGSYFSAKFNLIYLRLNTYHMRTAINFIEEKDGFSEDEILLDLKETHGLLIKDLVRRLSSGYLESSISREEMIDVLNESYLFFPYDFLTYHYAAKDKKYIKESFKQMMMEVGQELSDEFGVDMFQFMKALLYERPFNKKRKTIFFHNRQLGNEDIEDLYDKKSQLSIYEFIFYRGKRARKYYKDILMPENLFRGEEVDLLNQSFDFLQNYPGLSRQEPYINDKYRVNANIRFIEKVFELPKGWKKKQPVQVVGQSA